MGNKNNRYIRINGTYVKDDLKSFLLYWDYFFIQKAVISHTNRFVRKIKYSLLKTGSVFFYICKIYNFRYKKIFFQDNALIIIKGPLKQGYTIRLVERKKKLVIIKKMYNHKIFNKEKTFYETYKNNPSLIKLPHCIFKKNNIIEIEFLKTKSFMRLIIDGTFNFDTVLKHFEIIKKEMKLFYKKRSTLIHGDLWLTNIFISNKQYYLIDFGNSMKGSLNYDLYILLYSTLSTHRFIAEEEKYIPEEIVKKLSVLKLLETSSQNFRKFEKKFNITRGKFHSNLA